MSSFNLLPLVIIAVTAALTWAAKQHLEMAHKHRVEARHRPRSRPYAETLPESLTRN